MQKFSNVPETGADHQEGLQELLIKFLSDRFDAGGIILPKSG
jgi:hypothetical protein